MVESKALFGVVHGDVYMNSEKKQTLIIDKSQTNITIQQNLSIELPNLQGDFEKLKDLLAAANPGLKEKLDKIGDSLDELGPGSDKEKFNKPLNKLGRFIKDLDDRETPLGKTVSGLKKAVDLGQKIGRSYNKIGQWLALPHVPDVLLGSKK
ncbi:MAG: hypothetical protein KAW12_29425 [Candidatus Aminicenantes bacterium]|nr:hypothetical protein [Candidatus Aminicenantes bacterium]